MSPLVLVPSDQGHRDDLVDRLLADHALACELRAQLDATPGWRRLKRRRVDQVLRGVCADADRVRDLLGATGSGEGMYDLLERTAARVNGALR